MAGTEPPERFSLVSFGLRWVASALLTWALGCLAALALVPQELEAGLLPTEVLLALGLIPVSGAALVVQILLLAIGRKMWPSSRLGRGVPPCLVTSAVTLLSLWAFMLLLGGADSFIPRL